jgi:guanylate kinase
MEGHLIRLFPGALHVVSDTTRIQRPNEIARKDYNFIPIALFKQRIEENYYAEYEEVHGKYYGTPKIVIQETRARAPLAISPIDYKGARKLIQLYPDAIPIFLKASIKILTERLRKREGTTEEEILRRMKTAEDELAQVDTFPHVVDTTGTIHYTLERVKYILRVYGRIVDVECDECS